MQQAKSDVLQLTDANGRPIDNDNQTLSAGPTGPLLLMDTNFVEKLAHFDRERIPERVVHAKGFGAHGYFEVTKDITKLSKAKLFEKVGKKTPIFARWSTVIGEKGSADTRRDPRGFAVKFYTEEGNWDMVGNNVPIFFVNDPVKFPDLIHSLKRNPQTNLPDANMMWDFLSQTPESTHMVTMLFSDRGIPVGYRHMNGYGTHTFKWINDQGEVTFVKLHFLTNQGIKTFTAEEGRRLEGEAPEFAAQDFITAVNNKEYPTWRFYVQTIPEAEVSNATFNILDPTKVWPHSQYPLTEVGKLVFDRNVENYHAETEQVSFSPGVLVPGMEPSNDKLLQGRIFSYPDAQRYRVGPNYQQLPINCPFMTRVANGQRDGPMASNNQGNRLHYGPSSWGNYHESKKYQMTMYELHGLMGKHNWNSDSDHFSQPRALFENVMSETDRQHLISNVAGNLKDAAQHIQERQIILFFKVHVDYGKGVANLLGLDAEKLQQAAQQAEQNGTPSSGAKITPIVHKTVKSEILTSPSSQRSKFISVIKNYLLFILIFIFCYNYFVKIL